jgi:hypothetical protein
MALRPWPSPQDAPRPFQGLQEALTPLASQLMSKQGPRLLWAFSQYAPVSGPDLNDWIERHAKAPSFHFFCSAKGFLV